MQSLLEWLPYLALVATVGCVGVLGVTVARNVPLNNTLAATPAATAAFAIGLLDWGARFG